MSYELSTIDTMSGEKKTCIPVCIFAFIDKGKLSYVTKLTRPAFKKKKPHHDCHNH